MKILVETFAENESGPVFAYNVLEGLKKNGVDVFGVITSKTENVDEWRKTISDEKLFIWDGKPNKKKVIKTIKNMIRLMRQFRNEKFDYVLLTNPAKIDILVSRCISYRHNIMILHDAIPHSSTSEKLNDYTQSIIKKADKIMVLSKEFIDYVSDVYGRKKEEILYMRHGLMEYPKCCEKISENTISSIVNFLFFGRIDGYKGLHVLAEAYKISKLKCKNITLTVAGNGDFSEYKNEYEKLEDVNIVNKYIDNELIAELFSQPNTVVVLPYLDATQSGVIGIAYNYLTPVIVSDVGAIKEQLFNGENGIFVEAGNACDLAIKMMQVVENPDIYTEQKNRMEQYKNRMSWEYITKELLTQLDCRV